MSIPANIFELLQDENDSEVKKAPTSTKEQPKKASTTAQPAKTQDRQTAVDRSGEKKVTGPSRQKVDRKPFQAVREPGSASGAPPARFSGERSRENRPPRQQGESRERKEKQAERTEDPKHRAFERRSGTGRGREQKRGGAGRGNWGTQEDDQKAQVETTTEQPTTTEETTEQQTPATEEKSEVPATEAQPEVNPEDEEDAKLKTLDDYRKSLKTPTLSPPPPRVVEDKGEWSKYTALKRYEDEAPQKKATKKEEKEEKEEKEDSSKKIRADEVLRFTEGSPKDRDRSSRGGFRGKDRRDSPRGGRGGKRGGIGRGSAPNFSDERSFPSLATATKA